MAHLSYKKFKEQYGKTSVTDWVKFNWLGVTYTPVGGSIAGTYVNNQGFDGAATNTYTFNTYPSTHNLVWQPDLSAYKKTFNNVMTCLNNQFKEFDVPIEYHINAIEVYSTGRLRIYGDENASPSSGGAKTRWANNYFKKPDIDYIKISTADEAYMKTVSVSDAFVSIDGKTNPTLFDLIKLVVDDCLTKKE